MVTVVTVVLSCSEQELSESCEIRPVQDSSRNGKSEAREPCEWEPHDDAFDSFSGRCVSIVDVCDDVDTCEAMEESCRQLCKIVDRCETDAFREGKTCCGLEEDACGSAPESATSGTCQLRVDSCANLKQESFCSASALCSRAKGSGRHVADKDPCSPLHDAFGSNTQQNAQGNPLCAWKERCADACWGCGDCIVVMEHATLSLPPDANAFSIAAAIQEACSSTIASKEECRRLAIQVRECRNGTLDRWPAALCPSINHCMESGSMQQDEADVAIDMCSPTGLISGAIIVKVSSLSAELCNNKLDCQAAEYCSFTSGSPSCKCHPKEGSAICVSVGECKDFCHQCADHIETFYDRFAPCAATDKCATGVTCDTGSAWKCEQMSSSGETGLQISSCDGICVSAERTMSSATFDDRGDRISVDLNFLAPRRSFPCSAAFDKAMVDLVGVHAQCSATSKELTVYLLEGATISPADKLTLSTDQGNLVDILETPFSGQMTVATCDSCEPPSMLTLYPELISPGCGHSVSGVLFDSSCSMDPTRRGLGYNWTIDTDECYRIETSGPFGADPSCLEVANTLQAHSIESLFELPASTVSPLPHGGYQLRLDIVNHLSTSSFSDVVFTRAATPVPVVGIFGEQERDFEIKNGFDISAFMDESSLCDNYALEYLRVSTDDSPWGAIPQEGYTRKNLKAPGDAAPDRTYGLRLVAYLYNWSGIQQGQASLDVHTTAIGSLLVAKLDGPTKDVVLKEDACLNASASCDPDDPSTLSELSATWKCKLNGLGGKACFTGKALPIIEGTKLCIPKEALTLGRRHLYTLTISRTQFKQTRSAVAAVKFGPRDEVSLIPTGLCRRRCATLVKEGVQETGEAVVSFATKKLPNCGNAETGDCFIVEKTSESSHYADVSFLAKARGFVDEDSKIVYKFGETVRRSFVLFQRGPSAAYEFKCLSQGNHTLVVKATEASGGFVQQEETVMVLQPEGDIILDSLLDEVVLSADEGTRSGDLSTVFQESRKGTQLLELAEETGGIAADDGKIIAQKFAEASIAQMPSVEDVDPDEYTIAQGVLGKLAQSGWTEASVVDQMLDSVITGLTASDYGARAFKGENCQDVLNVVSSGAEKRIVGDDPKVQETSVFYEKLQDASSLCSNLSRSTLTPGVDPVTSTTSSTKVDPIVMQCSKDSIESLGGKSTAIQTTEGTAGRKLQSSEAQPSAKLLADFHTKRGEVCPVETIGTSLQYFDVSSTLADLVGEIYSIGAMDVRIVSGILEVELTDHVGGLCPDASLAHIPVDDSIFSTDDPTMCVRVEDGKAVIEDGISYLGYEQGTGVVACEFQKLGEMFIVQYSHPPVAPPPPAALKVAFPAPNWVSAPPVIQNEYKARKIKSELTFIGDHASPKQDETFLMGIRRSLADFVGVDTATVQILGIRAGSTVVETGINIPLERADSEIKEIEAALTTRPEELFENAFITQSGVRKKRGQDTDIPRASSGRGLLTETD